MPVNNRKVCPPIPWQLPFFAKSGVPRANSLTTSTMYQYYEELFRLELMRRWRTPKDENRVQRAGPRRRVSVWYKHPWMAVAWRSGNVCEDIDPVG